MPENVELEPLSIGQQRQCSRLGVIFTFDVELFLNILTPNSSLSENHHNHHVFSRT